MAASLKDIQSLVKALLVARLEFEPDIDKIANTLESEEFSRAIIDQAVQDIKQARAQAEAKKEYDLQMSAALLQRKQLETEQKAREESQRATAEVERKKKTEQRVPIKSSGFTGWAWIDNYFSATPSKNKTSSASAESSKVSRAAPLDSNNIPDFEDAENLLETVFEQHERHMIKICEDLNTRKKTGLVITRKNLDDIFAEYRQEDPETQVSIEILSRLLYRADKKTPKFKLDEKELSERLNLLIQFFTAKQIKEVMTVLHQKLQNTPSEEFSINAEPTDSPVVLSPLGLAHEKPIPSVPHSAAPAMTTNANKLAVNGSPSLTGLVKVTMVKNWFQRLMEVILEQKLACPEPGQIDALIDKMQAKPEKSTKKRT